MNRSVIALMLLVVWGSRDASAQAPRQPKVQPGPNEPDWVEILDRSYGLKMFDDLVNPVTTTPDAARVLFRKAGSGPVTFAPTLALGLEVPIHGGYYTPGGDASGEVELWSYTHKSTTAQVLAGGDLRPPLKAGSKVEFDPDDSPFGLWIGNDEFRDRVYSEPSRVAAQSPRLAKQPYKVMVYPLRDKATGKVEPNAYVLGWEYSTNDDFQDVVCVIRNVTIAK